MMPGVGFEEMILLVLVAIVVIGPKDLPLMMRKFGRFTGKMRAMAFEFKQGFDELGRQAELEELRKEVADLKKVTGLDDLRKEFEDDKRNLEADVRSAMDPVAPPTPATPQISAPDPTPASDAATPNAEPSAEPASETPAVANGAAAAVATAAAAPFTPMVRTQEKFPRPIKRAPTHPAAAAAVARQPAPYAGLSPDHPGYDTGDDFRLEGHPAETFAPKPVASEAAPAVNGVHQAGDQGASEAPGDVHIIPDDEVRLPPAKQDTPA